MFCTLLYFGLRARTNVFMWFCISLVLFEGVVLLPNRGTCLSRTPALEYYPELSEGSNIFFQEWLHFRGFKRVFTALFLIALVLLLAARW